MVDAHQGLRPALLVDRIELQPGVAHHLGQRGDVGADHGAAARHGLQDRDAEALIERGEREGARRGVDLRQVALRQIAREVNRGAGSEGVEVGIKAVDAPAGLADQHQRQVGDLLPRSSVGAGQEEEVLPRLERPDREYVARGKPEADARGFNLARSDGVREGVGVGVERKAHLARHLGKVLEQIALGALGDREHGASRVHRRAEGGLLDLH